MKRLPALLLVAALALPVPALAQGNQGADDQSASDRGGGTGADAGGAAAHVGADTTNSATTGFSEPPKGKPTGPSKPPELTAELCTSVEGTDAHPDCLSKVMGEKTP